MKFVNVREFSSSATKLLRDDVEKGQTVVITKRGKPVGLIIPFKDKIAVAEALLEEADSLLKESGLTEVDVLRMLEKVRERADFLLTGDKDLLEISPKKLKPSGLNRLKIVSPDVFLSESK